MKGSRLALTWIAMLALGAALPAEAKLYKWVAADGSVTYSERKPPDAEAEEVKVHNTAVSDEQARSNLESLTERSEAGRADRESQASHTTAMKEREERIAKNCEIARENLRILETNSRIKESEDGNARYLAPDEIQGRTDTARANIEKYC